MSSLIFNRKTKEEDTHEIVVNLNNLNLVKMDDKAVLADYMHAVLKQHIILYISKIILEYYCAVFINFAIKQCVKCFVADDTRVTLVHIKKMPIIGT